MEFDDRTYETTMGSDLDRDGMFLELDEVTVGGRETLAEWFYSDVDGSMEFTEYTGGIPDAVLEWFRAEAARRLPPNAGAV
jgi:hypothetical protein